MICPNCSTEHDMEYCPSRAYLHQHFVFALHTWTAMNLVGTPILLSMRAIQQVAAFLSAILLAARG